MAFNHDKFKGKLIDLSPSNKESITQARRSSSSTIRPNRSAKYASHVLEELLTLAHEEHAVVRLISGSLNSDCYDPLASIAKDILQSAVSSSDNPRIRVILTNPDRPDLANNGFYQAIASSEAATIKVAGKSEDTNAIPHFATIGDFAFRFETKHESAEADYSFNNPDLTRDLVDYFDRWFDVLSPFDLESNHIDDSCAA